MPDPCGSVVVSRPYNRPTSTLGRALQTTSSDLGTEVDRPIVAAEYFAGIGLARLGLAHAGVQTVWSNDISPDKHSMHLRNFGQIGSKSYVVGDLGRLAPHQHPPVVDLAWASFPCTDLSQAGGRAGLSGAASSAFWLFIKSLSAMRGQKPAVIAIENVAAFATSRSGRDIASAIRSLNGLGYSVDALLIDAKNFVPQSRPRIFLIGCLRPAVSTVADHLTRPTWLLKAISDPTLRTHRMELPQLPERESDLGEIVEPLAADDPRWWTAERVDAFKSSQSELQRERLSALVDSEMEHVRTAYRRMRAGAPRWEMRSDDMAGCLRTSRGGSSRQAVVFAGRGNVRIRWMTPQEYARLMGAPSFKIDGISTNLAYSGFGDAVCAPVVEWLARHYLVPEVVRQRREDSAVPMRLNALSAEVAS